MTSQELRAKLITIRDTDESGKPKKTDAEIEAIVQKFEQSAKKREVFFAENRMKSEKFKIGEILKEFDSKDCRLFCCLGMGIFVKREGDVAKVAFSFLNPEDMKENARFSARSFKLHALENFKLDKFTYEVKWQGRSEFAIYDAYVKNHKKFPGIYKKMAISTCIGIFDPSDKRVIWESVCQ